MLSRLISLLSRIPAVKWAFNRLRPLPHGGKLDVAPNGAPAAVAEAARDIDDTLEPIVAESPSAAPDAIIFDDDSSAKAPTEVEPAFEQDISTFPVELASDTIDAPEPIGSDPPAKRLTDSEPDVVEAAPIPSVEVAAVDGPRPIANSDGSQEPSAEEPSAEELANEQRAAVVAPIGNALVIIPPVETEMALVEPSEIVTEDDPASVASMKREPVAIDETPVVVEAEVPAPVVAASSSEGEPAPGVAAEIAPVVASNVPPVAAVVAEETIADAPVAATDIALARVSPAPKSPSAPKARAKILEPADRTALIRQRWAETGIRMWNPRLHGTGDAALNIQGRIGLLPPEAGQTMPRYDKLEFKMLGGQIVCEGVIVEAPAHAGQRSFTRLAEPHGADRSREPVRQRQAALA